MKEIWKNIEGYENYMVSNLGRVKSLNYNRTCQERILKPGKNKGYLQVYLCKDGKIKRFYLHRLVAKVFIPNPENKPFINHRDETRSNNCVENLEWCTAKYNINYGTCIEKRSTKIKCLDLYNNETTYFSSITEAARQLNISEPAIRYSMYKSKKPYKKRFIFSEI